MNFLLRIVRTKVGGRLLGFVLKHFRFIFPIKKLYESESWIAFPHPVPSYPVHILIVPKKPIGSLNDLNADHGAMLLEMLNMSNSLHQKCKLMDSKYQIIVNGGNYQEVPLLHFHLISNGQRTHISSDHPHFISN